MPGPGMDTQAVNLDPAGDPHCGLQWHIGHCHDR